jgi:DNA-binding protein H-NS
MDERKRDSIVAYLRRRMDEFNISVDDLAAALAHDQIAAANAKYRSAKGETWDGTGDMPQWLKQAASAGQKLEHFATAMAKETAEAAKRREVDWRADPFAGTRLATVRAPDNTVN